MIFLSINPTHNTTHQPNSVILIEKQRNIENLVFDHPALLILDVSKGQLTEPVLNELKDYHIFTCQVSANMTHILQPLDLTVNVAQKGF